MKRDHHGRNTSDMSCAPCFICSSPATKTLTVRPTYETAAATGMPAVDFGLCAACAGSGDGEAWKRVQDKLDKDAGRVTPPPDVTAH